MTKKFFIVLDTETANSVEQPLPYDAGWAVIDRDGNVYETRSYVVAEIYLGCKDTMKTAYYADKLPQYEKDLKEGKRELKSIWSIRKQLLADMKKYKTNKVGAYNMLFDKRALNNDIRYISKSWLRWFFPYGTEFFCIWNIACQVLMARPSYIKFAEENGFISDKGNILTNAECCYRYITKDINFEESHTGLEDVLIETAILAYCYKQHKKFDSKPYSACWRTVQRARVEKEIKDAFKNRGALN